MVNKVKMDNPQDEFNRWAKELQVSTRFDYTNFENQELVKRIEEAKFAQLNSVAPTPSELLQSQQTDRGTILSGIKSLIYNFF